MGLSESMKEQWVEFAIGMFVILLRIFTRTKIVGFRGWQGDDYMILFSAICFSIQLAMHQMVDRNGTVNSLNLLIQNTPEKIAQAVQGSKENIVTWVIYVSLIWSLKGCMLFLYARLTIGLKQRRWVTFASAFCAVTYVASILLIFLNCRPFYLNWTPAPNLTQLCKQNLPHFYIIGPLNVLTDVMLLCIPIPLIYRAHLPLRRKLGVGLVLSGGVFIILATILNNTFSLLYKYDSLYSILNGNFKKLGSNNGSFILSWGAREAFVAVLTVNVPCIKPLFSSSVWLKDKSKNSQNSIATFGSSGRQRIANEESVLEGAEYYRGMEMQERDKVDFERNSSLGREQQYAHKMV